MSRTTYEDAISRLNSRSLDHALRLISLLSAVESEGGAGSPISSLVNSEFIRLTAEALIKSKASWYKERPVEPNDLPVLVNGSNEALEDKRLHQEVISGGERQEMLYKLQRYFARLAYIQIRPQQEPFVAIGRTLAILEVIPDQHLNRLPSQLRNEASLFLIRVREVLGLSVSEIIMVHLSIMDYFGRLGQLLLQSLPCPKLERFSAGRQSEILGRLVASSHNYLHFFCLTRDVIGEVEGEHVGKILPAYAAIFGRRVAIHRELLEHKEYQVGPAGHRLSPLDRFPLIGREVGNGWYVPNVRGFACSAPEVLHFTLNEICREPYQNIRGSLLEIYLQLMLERRAPDLIVIPEKRWSSPKGGIDGPDLLIIDHSADPVVIAVEVKSRRMVLATRYQLLDDDLIDNYTDLWKALKRLPDKVAMVFSFAGDYAEHKYDLNLAKSYPVYYLGVAGETPYLFGELAEYRRLHDPDFPLYGFDVPVGVMSVETFERMLEVSVQGGRSIAGVLREYLEDCTKIELSSAMAESFRNVGLAAEQSFGFTFLSPLWPGAEQN
jgi:hypothetical protein